MKEKITKAIFKLYSTSIHPQLTYVFFNTYLIASVYFRCRIMTIIEKQELELIKIYEKTVLTKLGLSKKFLRAILYSRKMLLGLGLLKPSIIIETLVLKLYTGH